MADHNSVAHNWANQTGKARTGFNMYYDGATIYSYGLHFPIARIVTDNAAPFVLFTSKDYSTSTTKHKSIVWRALNYGRDYPVFVVANVNARCPADHLDNYEAMITAARVSVGKAARARKWASLHLDSAKKNVSDANDYAAHFDLGVPTVHIENVAIAFAAVEARAEQMRAEAELARTKAARVRALADRERLRSWLNGANVYPPHTRVPYVRVNGDEVQTTWGASVPLVDALQAWSMMKHARNHTMGVDDIVLRVGNFIVDKITPQGMRVGCHFIPFKFAQLAAVNAGLES